ncbi:MAG: hypothetical protein ACE5EY_14000 [Anaerolineae bacterium]
MKRIIRGLTAVVLVLLAGIMTGVTLALLPVLAEDWGRPLKGLPNVVIIDRADSPEMVTGDGAPAAGRVTKGNPVTMSTAVPSPAASVFTAEMGEACRQAAVNNRRASPRCRNYFEWLGTGR